jgi:chitinase
MKTLPQRFLRARRRTRALVVLPILVAAFAGVTYAAFSSQTNNTGDSIAAAPDYAAPTVTAPAIIKTAGGVGNYLAQNTQFYVYANVTDTGNPASGIASVNASGTLPGYGFQTIPLATTGGPWTVGGVSYNYRSTLNTFPPMAEQTIPLNIDVADNAGNSGSPGFNLVIDNTAITGTNIQATNTSGGTVGRAEAGDTITYTFSEPPERESIVAGWNSGSQSVTVNLNNAGAPNGDNVTIPAAPALGTYNLRQTDYTTANRTFANSTMTLTGNTITIVLGTASGGVTTTAATATSQWVTSTALTDRAGNAMTAATVNETGAADKEF